MSIETNLLIIGAGPFGLSMCAYCLQNNIPHKIVGKPMDFWKSNMPAGMCLRSGYDWHLDPAGIDTLCKFMEVLELNKSDYAPLPLELYLEYAEWFQNQKGIEPLDKVIEKLDYDQDSKRFTSSLSDGDQILSENVLLAVGFKYFKNVPIEIAEKLPDGSYTHTCDINRFDKFNSLNCLVIGGRMSAFESAALLIESGSPHVYVSYRHDTPEFIESGWAWVTALLDEMVKDPSWYRSLDAEEKEEIGKRFYAEGRLKMEPWLQPRLDKDTVHLIPNSEITGCRESDNAKLEISLDNGKQIFVDHVILATGYKVNMENIPFLKHGSILEKLKLQNGYPVLDRFLQTNIPGLYVTSLAATQDFGPFFGFTVSVNTSAKIIGRYLQKK